MPDPAVEAARLGLPYVEPTGRGIKKAQVSTKLIYDPYDPTAPPRQRRVYEPKKGFWARLFDKDVDWSGSSMGKTPDMSSWSAPTSGHSAGMFGQDAGAGPPTGHSTGMFGAEMPMSGGWGGPGMPGAALDVSSHGMSMGMGGHSLGMGMGMGGLGSGMEMYGATSQQPLQQEGWPNLAMQIAGLPPPPAGGMSPESLALLPKYERKQLKRMQDAYDKMVKEHMKAEEKRVKQAMKEHEKMFKQALRSGLGRPMPFPIPMQAMQEKASATPLQPPPDLGPIHTWDPVPTLEQFGMRRPWNGLAEPAPPISRTMTLACADMNRDEMNQQWLDKRQWVSLPGRTW